MSRPHSKLFLIPTIAVALLAILATPSLGQARPAPSVETGNVVETSSVEFDIVKLAEVRGKAGFDASLERTRELSNDDSSALRSNGFGFPMTGTELAEMEYRVDVLQPAVANLIPKLRESELGTFATAYVDHARGGRVVVASTEPLSEVGALVAEREIGARDRILFEIVLNSESELRRARLGVEQEYGKLEHVIGFGTLPMDNIVFLQLLKDDPVLRFEVEQKYGESVLVYVSDVDVDDSEIVGGARIRRSATNGSSCSEGPWGYRIAQFGLKNHYMTTAGHCSGVTRRLHNIAPDFTAASPRFFNIGTADVVSLLRTDGLVATNEVSHRIFSPPNTPGLIVQIAQEGDFADEIGTWACQSGWVTRHNNGMSGCGTILSTNSRCAREDEQRLVTYPRRGGDSGATAYAPTSFGFVLTGLHNGRKDIPTTGGGTQRVGCYSFQQNALDTLDLDAWHTYFDQ